MADRESWVSVDTGVKVAKTCEGPWCCYLYELNPQVPASGFLVAPPVNKIQSAENMTIICWVFAKCCQLSIDQARLVSAAHGNAVKYGEGGEGI